MNTWRGWLAFLSGFALVAVAAVVSEAHAAAAFSWPYTAAPGYPAATTASHPNGLFETALAACQAADAAGYNGPGDCVEPCGPWSAAVGDRREYRCRLSTNTSLFKSGPVQLLSVPYVGPCDLLQGQQLTRLEFHATIPDVGGVYTNPSASGCKMSITGLASCETVGSQVACLVTYTYDTTLSSTPTPPDVGAGQEAECALINGVKNCGPTTNADGDTCMILGGENVCIAAEDLEQSDTDPACWTTGSGGMVCTEGVAPQDSSGTPITPTSTSTVTNADGSTSTVNYYNRNTVVSNGATGVSSGDAGTGEEEGTGDDACPEGGDCSGTLGELGEVDSFGDVTQGFMDRVAAAPLIDAVSNLGDDLPAGACPNWNIEVFDQTISLSAPMCDIWSTIAPILSGVMLVAWGLLAARIVLTA